MTKTRAMAGYGTWVTALSLFCLLSAVQPKPTSEHLDPPTATSTLDPNQICARDIDIRTAYNMVKEKFSEYLPFTSENNLIEIIGSHDKDGNKLLDPKECKMMLPDLNIPSA